MMHTPWRSLLLVVGALLLWASPVTTATEPPVHAANEAACNALGGFCVCSHTFQTAFVVDGTTGPGYDVVHETDMAGKRCGDALVGANPTFPVSTGRYAFISAPAGLPSGIHAFELSSPSGGGVKLQTTAINTGVVSKNMTGRVGIRQYVYYSPNYESTDAEFGGTCNNDKQMRIGDYVTAYRGGYSHSNFIGYWTPGPEQLRGKWVRLEYYTADHQNTTSYDIYWKNITDNGPEYHKTIAARLGVFNAANPCQLNPDGSILYCHYPENKQPWLIDGYREGTCAGYRRYAYTMMANWPNSAGQRIPTAVEIEGGVLPPTDTVPPTTPTSLTATGGALSVSLSHGASTDANSPITYIHERCSGASCSNFSVVSSGTSTSFTDSGLTAATSYSYRVKAQDPNGNQSGYSNTATATTSSGSAGGSLSFNSAGQAVVNGTQTFLLGVSYFDATVYKTSDLDTFAARGFNLWRAWATWNIDLLHGTPNRSVCDLNGALKSTERDQLQGFVAYAKTKNAMVQLVILDVGADALMTTQGARTTCVTNVVNYYKSTSAQANWNVLFDVVQEHDSNYPGTEWAGSVAQVNTYVDAAKAACTTCTNPIYASASFIVDVPAGFPDGFIGPQTGATLTTLMKTQVTNKIQTNLESVLEIHEARDTNWYSSTGARVAAYKAHLASIGATGTPVIFGEPQRDDTSAHMLTAVVQARDAGAAGWVFHNNDSFDLRTLPVFSQFSVAETDFTLSVAGALSGAPGSGTTPTIHANSSDTFTRGDNSDLGTSWLPGFTNTQPLNLVSNAVQATINTSESLEIYTGATASPASLYTCTGANEGPPPTGFLTKSGNGLKRVNATSSCGWDATSTVTDSVVWNADFADDQDVQATLSALPTGTNVDYASLFVRAQATSGGYDNLYNGVIFSNGTNYTMEINKFVSGVQTTIGATYTGSASVNDVFLLRAVGSQITLYQNGIARNTATDTAFPAGGFIGMGSFRSAVATAVRWKNFSGGSYTASFTTPANQGRTITLGTVGGAVTQYAAVILRSTTIPSWNSYLCEIRTNPSAIQLRKKTAGSGSNLTTLISVSPAWTTGDVLGCFVNGSTLYATRGSVTSAPLASVTDSTYTAGSTGLYVHATSGGVVTNLTLAETAGYEFTVPPALCTPKMSSITLDQTGANVTWDASCPPTQIRLRWDTGSLIEPLSVFVRTGTTYRYTKTGGWAPGTTYVCADAVDAQGRPNTNLADIFCNSITVAYDQAPPVLSNGQPTATQPTSTVLISTTVDKLATCRIDTSNPAGTDYTAFLSLANTMTVSNFLASYSATGLTNGSYVYYVRCNAVDALEVNRPNPTSLVIAFAVNTTPADSTAPSTVTGLVGAALSATQIQLNWLPATDNVLVAGYQTYFCSEDTCATPILNGLTTTNTSIVLGAVPNTTSAYCVEAIDSSGNRAVCSNVATVTTPPILDITPPSDMSNLRLITAFELSVVLSWDQGTDNNGLVISNIEQCQGASCTNFALVPPGGIQGSTLLTSLLPSTLYRFRGKHCDVAQPAANCSVNYSNILDVTTGAAGLGLQQLRRPLVLQRLPRN